MMQFNWQPIGRNWLELKCPVDAFVRTVPDPAGRYLWQFGKVASYAPSIAEARDYVEAGAEYYAQFRRNPYG
jgi:hypothetical protein